MVEIKCNEMQKEAIINTMAVSRYCIIECEKHCNDHADCADCLEKNIKWVIEENEDA